MHWDARILDMCVRTDVYVCVHAANGTECLSALPLGPGRAA